MKRALIVLALLSLTLTLMLGISANVALAAEECHVHTVTYGATWCNINDWCWWYDGQLWTERDTLYHCTTDGGVTWYDKNVHDHVLGNCCYV